MAEMTLEQKRAIAIAEAKLRLQEQESNPGLAGAPSTGDRLESVAKTAAVTANRGPLGMMAGLASEGQRQFGQFMEHAAYDAGGKATDLAMGMGASPETAAKLGYGTNVATQAVPAVVGGLAGKFTQANVPNPFRWGGRTLMQQAIKPSQQALRSGEAKVAIDTALEKGIDVSKGGMSDLAVLIDKAGAKIDNLIDSAPKGRMVNRDFIKQSLNAELKEIRKRMDLGEDLRVVAKLWQRLKTRFDKLIPLDRAQEAKKAEMAYLRNRNVYDNSPESALLNAREAAASGMRAGIEDVVPEIKELNREFGKLLATRKVLAPKVAMAGNKEVFGQFPLMSYAAGGGSNTGAAMALTQMIDRNPWIKSLLARQIYNIPRNAGVLGGASLGALSADQDNRFLNGVLGRR